MNYEKKYNEALERARALWREAIEKGYVDDYLKDYETIFPELRESEDERIRKWLADYFSSIKATEWIHRDITCEQILEWLEKQKPMYNLEIPSGDVAPAEEDGPFDEDDFLENELSAFLQNYDKEYDDDAAVSDVARHFYEIGKKQKEQKPAEWSEEDEMIMKLLIWQVYRNIEDETNDLAQSVYDGIKGHDPDLEESIEDWKKCLAWLKSLRPDIYKNCNSRRKPSED